MQRRKTSTKENVNSRTSQDTTSTSGLQLETSEQYSSARNSQQPSTNSSRGQSTLKPSVKPKGLKSLRINTYDLTQTSYRDVLDWQSISIDTELDGLDYQKDKLRLIQLGNPNGQVIIVREPKWQARFLTDILHGWQPKIFHHAFFDIKRIYANTGIKVDHPIDCTKTLMKITHPEMSSGLQTGLRELLGIHISKAEQQSNWSLPDLTKEQLWYASGDVLYLPQLSQYLIKELRLNQLEIYQMALRTIREKAFLEVEGYTDLLDYEQEKDLTLNLSRRNWWTTQLVKNGDKE